MAVDMFLKLDKIEGESKDSTHAKEIDVIAWSWGASNSGSMHKGGSGARGKVAVSDLSVTKKFDKASPVLIQHVTSGESIPKAVLTVRKPGTKPLEYIIITMENVIVVSYSTGGGGGEDALTENLVLNFEKFHIKYTEQKASGVIGDKPEFAFDIPKNEAA